MFAIIAVILLALTLFCLYGAGRRMLQRLQDARLEAENDPGRIADALPAGAEQAMAESPAKYEGGAAAGSPDEYAEEFDADAPGEYAEEFDADAPDEYAEEFDADAPDEYAEKRRRYSRDNRDLYMLAFQIYKEMHDRPRK